MGDAICDSTTARESRAARDESDRLRGKRGRRTSEAGEGEGRGRGKRKGGDVNLSKIFFDRILLLAYNELQNRRGLSSAPQQIRWVCVYRRCSTEHERDVETLYEECQRRRSIRSALGVRCAHGNSEEQRELSMRSRVQQKALGLEFDIEFPHQRAHESMPEMAKAAHSRNDRMLHDVLTVAAARSLQNKQLRRGATCHHGMMPTSVNKRFSLLAGSRTGKCLLRQELREINVLDLGSIRTQGGIVGARRRLVRRRSGSIRPRNLDQLCAKETAPEWDGFLMWATVAWSRRLSRKGMFMSVMDTHGASSPPTRGSHLNQEPASPGLSLETFQVNSQPRRTMWRMHSAEQSIRSSASPARIHCYCYRALVATRRPLPADPTAGRDPGAGAAPFQWCPREWGMHCGRDSRHRLHRSPGIESAWTGRGSTPAPFQPGTAGDRSRADRWTARAAAGTKTVTSQRRVASGNHPKDVGVSPGFIRRFHAKVGRFIRVVANVRLGAARPSGPRKIMEPSA